MYRAITLYFLRNHVDWTRPEAVDEALRHIRLEFVTNHKNGHTETYLNGENVEYVIRDLVVAEKVSEVAAGPGASGRLRSPGSRRWERTRGS